MIALSAFRGAPRLDMQLALQPQQRRRIWFRLAQLQRDLCARHCKEVVVGHSTYQAIAERCATQESRQGQIGQPHLGPMCVSRQQEFEICRQSLVARRLHGELYTAPPIHQVRMDGSTHWAPITSIHVEHATPHARIGAIMQMHVHAWFTPDLITAKSCVSFASKANEGKRIRQKRSTCLHGASHSRTNCKW